MYYMDPANTGLPSCQLFMRTRSYENQWYHHFMEPMKGCIAITKCFRVSHIACFLFVCLLFCFDISVISKLYAMILFSTMGMELHPLMATDFCFVTISTFYIKSKCSLLTTLCKFPRTILIGLSGKLYLIITLIVYISPFCQNNMNFSICVQ